MHMQSSELQVVTPRPLRIFLCHSADDKPAVRSLYQSLRSDGFEPWLDEEDLLPGQEWEKEIVNAVRASDVVIVCFSKASVNKKGYVQKEIKFSLDVADELPEGTFFLLPVKLEECEIPQWLKIWQWINLFEADGYERLRRALKNRAETLASSITSERSTDDVESLRRTLTMMRREMAILEQQATSYTVLTLPVDIALKLDDKRKEIQRLEENLEKMQGPISSHEGVPAFEPAYSTFLSYSRSDADIMLRFKSDLERQGFHVWVDEADLEIGTETWEAEIQNALEHANCLIVLMSPDSKQSKWVLRELSYAERHGIRIFPVLIRGAEIDAVPVRLSSTMWVDARGNYSRALQRLVIAVRKQFSLINSGTHILETTVPKKSEISNTPSNLETGYETRITSLQDQIAELQSQLGARYSLIFEVDTQGKSQIYIRPDPDTSKFLDDGTAIYGGYLMDVNLRIRFKNHDINRGNIEEVILAIIKLEDREECEVPLQDSTLEQTEEGAGKVNLSEMDILGRRRTPYYRFYYRLKMDAKCVERLDEDCCLRVIMHAMGQPSYQADFNVNWKSAIYSQDWTPVSLNSKRN